MVSVIKQVCIDYSILESSVQFVVNIFIVLINR